MATKKTAPAARKPAKPRGHVVLIVDDEDEVLTSLHRLVERSLPGSHVLTAASGAEGLDILSKNKVDLIVTDYKMPGMDGLAFLQRAVKIAPKVPRLMITAFPDPDLAAKAVKEAGVALLITKPFDPDYFVGVIGSIFSRSRRA